MATSESRELKATATHYLLDGGIWKVPLEHYPDFLKLLAEDLNNGEKHYISENKTDIFKFICDFFSKYRKSQYLFIPL
jgi:hypothetical protein